MYLLEFISQNVFNFKKKEKTTNQPTKKTLLVE